MAQYIDSKRKQLDCLSKKLKTSKYVWVAGIFEHMMLKFIQYCGQGGSSPLVLNFSVAFRGLTYTTTNFRFKRGVITTVKQ